MKKLLSNDVLDDVSGGIILTDSHKFVVFNERNNNCLGTFNTLDDAIACANDRNVSTRVVDATRSMIGQFLLRGESFKGYVNWDLL